MNWDTTDFLIMGVLLLSSGSIFVFLAKKAKNTTQRVILGLIVLAAFLFLWAELAVGIFTNWGS